MLCSISRFADEFLWVSESYGNWRSRGQGYGRDPPPCMVSHGKTLTYFMYSLGKATCELVAEGTFFCLALRKFTFSWGSKNFDNFWEVVVQWLAFGHANLGSRARVPISAGHFSFFGITAEWPKIIEIAAIPFSDGTYNVICIWGCNSNSLSRSQHIQERT